MNFTWEGKRPQKVACCSLYMLLPKAEKYVGLSAHEQQEVAGWKIQERDGCGVKSLNWVSCARGKFTRI